MTSTDAPRTNLPAGRVPRLVEIALILSLALNCFVVGGVVVTAWRFQPSPPPMAPEMALQELETQTGLSPDIRAQLVALFRFAHATVAETKSLDQPAINAYLAELSQPMPNRQKLATLEEQIRSSRITMHERISDALVQWMSQLTVEQRRSLVDVIRNERDPHSHGFRWIIGM